MNKILPQRKHNRLKGFDYSSSGWYFVTICTKNREIFFGEVINRKMVLNDYGRIVKQCWFDLSNHYLNCLLDEFIVMPNHIHGIIVIKNIKYVGAIFKSPNITGEINFAPTNKKLSLSTIMKWFKSISSIQIRKYKHLFQWQRSFYDHIIRNEKSLFAIREYIRNNPLKWEDDRENVENLYL